MPDVVVIDASIAMKWLIIEEDSDKARTLGRSWRNDSVRLAAPHIVLAEVSNALYQRVRRDLMSVAYARGLLRRFVLNGLEVHHTVHLYQRAIEIASQLNQGASYDSLYLALAESLDCDLWTADARFYRAARGRYPRVRLLAELDPQA